MHLYKDRFFLANKHNFEAKMKSLERGGAMGDICCEEESWVSSRNLIQEKETDQTHHQTGIDDDDDDDDDDDATFCQETEDIWQKVSQSNTIATRNSCKLNKTSSSLAMSNKKKKKSHVLLEGYVEVTSESNSLEDDLKKTKSLTDEDLDELKGCVDLGFGFSYDEIPELCNTLPALELCYSMSQKFLDEHHHKSPDHRTSPVAAVPEASSGPVANWKISSPGDHPEDVKARLKFWAQAVACTVRLCSLREVGAQRTHQ